MSETVESYGDNGINILSPAPTGQGGALLLNNDKALSDAIDGSFPKSGGTITGDIACNGSITANIINTGEINGSGNPLTLQDGTSGSIVIDTGNGNGISLNTGFNSGQAITTTSGSVIDDSFGNLSTYGGIAIGTAFGVGVNNTSLCVDGLGQVTTNYNTLDDGGGNMTVSGTINGIPYPFAFPLWSLDAVLSEGNQSYQGMSIGTLYVQGGANDGYTQLDGGFISTDGGGNLSVQSLVITGDLHVPNIGIEGYEADGFGSGLVNLVSGGLAVNGNPIADSSGNLFGNGSNISPLTSAALVGTLPAINGVNLTSLNASNLGSGTIPAVRFSTNSTSPGGVTTTGFTDSGSTAIHLASTYKGASGSTAYTIGDIVTALKSCGVLKS